MADGPWAARAKVREVVKYGADVIKICASGGVLSKGDQPGTPQYTLEEMKAIAEEAHKLGRKVAAHAHGTQSIKDAIRAGIDSIEHSSLIDDEGIALAKEHGTYLVFDIYNDDFILQEGAKAGMLPESIEKEKKDRPIAAREFPARVSSGRENCVRHGFRRVSARRQRQTIRENGGVGDEAARCDSGGDDQRGGFDGLGRQGRCDRERPLRGHDCGERRSAGECARVWSP